jgi:uncharacterized protein YacL
VFDRFDITPIVTYHLSSLRAPGRKGMSRGDRFMFVGVPLLGGAVAGLSVWWGLEVSNGLAPLLTACGLLVGGMLATFVFLTNLRIKVSEVETYRKQLQRLIGATVVSALYTAVIALAVSFLLVAVASIELLRLSAVAPYTVGVIVAALLHLVVNLLTVVRRLLGVYVEVFAQDFGPQFGVVGPDDQRHENNTRRRSNTA